MGSNEKEHELTHDEIVELVNEINNNIDNTISNLEGREYEPKKTILKLLDYSKDLKNFIISGYLSKSDVDIKSYVVEINDELPYIESLSICESINYMIEDCQKEAGILTKIFLSKYSDVDIDKVLKTHQIILKAIKEKSEKTDVLTKQANECYDDVKKIEDDLKKEKKHRSVRLFLQGIPILFVGIPTIYLFFKELNIPDQFLYLIIIGMIATWILVSIMIKMSAPVKDKFSRNAAFIFYLFAAAILVIFIQRPTSNYYELYSILMFIAIFALVAIIAIKVIFHFYNRSISKERKNIINETLASFNIKKFQKDSLTQITPITEMLKKLKLKLRY